MSKNRRSASNENMRRSRRSSGNRSEGRYQEQYLYGNAVPTYEDDYDYAEELREREDRQRELVRREAEARAAELERQRSEKEKERAAALTRMQVIVVTLMLGILTASIVGYVELMSRVTLSENRIHSLETKIENLKTKNDQSLEEINSSINLEEIKQIAINELGMKYADSSQIVTYSSESDDYVHQVQDAGN